VTKRSTTGGTDGVAISLALGGLNSASAALGSQFAFSNQNVYI